MADDRLLEPRGIIEPLPEISETLVSRASWLVSLLGASLLVACPQAEPVTCEPILQGDGGPPTGFEGCSDGRAERVASATCETPSVPGRCFEPSPERGCSSDADCTSRPYGRCDDVVSGVEGAGCICSFGCASDADCDPGSVCVCAGSGGGHPAASTCVPAACASSSDCDGERCLLAWMPGSCSPQYRIECTTPEDSCESTSDCGESEVCYPQNGAWSCVPSDCA